MFNKRIVEDVLLYTFNNYNQRTQKTELQILPLKLPIQMINEIFEVVSHQLC